MPGTRPRFTANEAKTVRLVIEMRKRASTSERRRAIRKRKRKLLWYRGRIRAESALTGWDKADRRSRYHALIDVYNADRIGTTWVRLYGSRSLRERAYREALKLVGVVESGGNNRGAEVEEIIREGGGLPGQAWCGWFMAAVYKRAGSRAVEWRWGAVRLLALIPGVKRTNHPKRGDMVRFTFDHVGMFVRDLGDEIMTIEGNTGRTGAVSDSSTGGDGVYLKRRPKSLVQDYLCVTK